MLWELNLESDLGPLDRDHSGDASHLTPGVLGLQLGSQEELVARRLG